MRMNADEEHRLPKKFEQEKTEETEDQKGSSAWDSISFFPLCYLRDLLFKKSAVRMIPAPKFLFLGGLAVQIS